MLYPDLIDVPIEVFGGYCPAVPPSDLAPGAASVVNDMMFPQGAARTRGGLQNFFTGPGIPTNAQVNGLKSYITPTLAQRLLVWDSLGNLFKENPQGTLNLINSRPYANLLYQSITLFGREYQAFSNGLGGFDIPRQFDDTNWDRVSQVGPGASPQVSDETLAYPLANSPGGAISLASTIVAGTTGLVQSGLLVTVKSLSVANLFLFSQVGDSVLIAGAGVAGYDGTWTLTKIIDPGTAQFIANVAGLAASGGGTVALNLAFFGSTDPTLVTTAAIGQPITVASVGVAGYNGNWTIRSILSAQVVAVITSFNLANSGGGTLTLGGNIVAGRHQISVAFITRQGFITQAAVPTFWISAGSKRAVLAQIPTGPSNVIARLILFTPVITPPALTGTFYSLPTGSTQIGASATMLISDNTTTTATIDFNDTILIAGFQAEYLFTQLELGESAFTIGYNSRMVWMGERNKLPNMVNLSFDGGYTSSLNLPAGWTLDPTNGAGNGNAVAGGFTADWMDAYAIVGDGATAIRGKIFQTAYQDYLQVPIIAKTTSYSVRARLARNITLAQGTLHINLSSVSGAFTTVGLAVTAAQLGTSYAEFTATLTDVPLATPPSDLILQVYADGTPTNNGVFLIDSIEPYPTNSPFNYSTARFSHAFNPESYDATTGQIQVRPGDGQQLRAGFPLRNNLYLAKDHYLGYVADDGVNEPASWAFNEVSGTIGICGPNAVDYTEEWAVFAERSGLYLCWGSDPVKITPEIQTDATGTGKVAWDKINWSAANTIWVRIDKVNKMILIGAPILAANTPNIVFMLDYRWLESAEEIAASPLITFSSFTGKLLAHGKGRRWAIWNITANSMTFAERSDGTVQPFYGNGGTFGVGNGKVYQQVDAALQASDDGVAINWRYRFYGCPSRQEEQQFQLSVHRKLLGYLKWRVVGAGNLLLSIITAVRTTTLRSYTMSTSPAGDGERDVNIHGERFFLEMAGNAVGTWGQIEQTTLCMKKDASIPVRGVSS